MKIRTRHGIHHMIIAAWKRQAIDAAASNFAGAWEMARASGEADTDKLHSQIGRLLAD